MIIFIKIDIFIKYFNNINCILTYINITNNSNDDNNTHNLSSNKINILIITILK